ncbi:DUF3887 domain-containing protein [bacterium]|nr:DUF3887 domain-containing protein [bacterium]
MNKYRALGIVAIIGIGCIAYWLTSSAHKPQSEGDKANAQMSTAVKFAGDFVNNRYAAVVPYLDDTVKAQLTEPQLATIMSAIQSKLGSPVSSGAPVLKKIPGYNIVYVPYKFQRGSQDVKVVFDVWGKVAGVGFVEKAGL